MNFSQPFPEPAAPMPYQIAMGVEEFIERIGAVYDEYARDEKADAPYHDGSQSPALDRWQQLGYPAIAQLLAHEPAVLEGLVKDCFDLEVLDRIIPGPQEGLPKFLVNSISRVTIAKGLITIAGDAYLHPMLVQTS
jgi:hypothetical protein